MIVTYEGRDYEFDLDEITNEQLKVIQSRGLTLLEFERKLAEGDMGALDALWWLMVTQNGEKVSIASVKYKPVKLARAIAAAQAAEKEAEAARKPDPTQE